MLNRNEVNIIMDFTNAKQAAELCGASRRCVSNLCEQERRTDNDKLEPWEHKYFSFFQHKECEYFPCHKAIDPNNFNCLFCFCPLYFFQDCGGSFVFLGNRIKDCSECTFPHIRENYGKVMTKIINAAKE